MVCAQKSLFTFTAGFLKLRGRHCHAAGLDDPVARAEGVREAQARRARGGGARARAARGERPARAQPARSRQASRGALRRCSRCRRWSGHPWLAGAPLGGRAVPHPGPDAAFHLLAFTTGAGQAFCPRRTARAASHPPTTSRSAGGPVREDQLGGEAAGHRAGAVGPGQRPQGRAAGALRNSHRAARGRGADAAAGDPKQNGGQP